MELHKEASDPQRPQSVPTKQVPSKSTIKNKYLDVKVIKATGLTAADLNGKSDPYCFVLFEDSFFKTKCIPNTLDPVWNQNCTFKVFSVDSVIRFILYDRDIASDDYIGEAQLLVKRMQFEEKTYELKVSNPTNIRTKLKITGTLTVSVQLSSRSSGMLSYYGLPLGHPYNMRLKAGDVLLFNHSRVDGMLISAGTGCKWNHVALVIHNGDILQLFEATADGVSLEPLEASLNLWMKVSKMIIGFLRIEDIPPEAYHNLKDALCFFAVTHNGAAYEKNSGDIIKGILKKNKKDDYSSFFCSELVAAALKEAGLLDPNIVSSNVMPGDFQELKLRMGHFSLAKVDSTLQLPTEIKAID